MLGFASLPLVTRYFSEADIGRLSLLQVTANFSVLLFGLGLDQAYVREYHEARDKVALLRTSLGPGLALLLAVLGGALLLGLPMDLWLFGQQSSWLSLLLVVALVVYFIAYFLALVLRMEERAMAYSGSQFVPRLVYLLVVLGIVFAGGAAGLISLLSAYVMSLLAAFVWVALLTRTEWLQAVRLGPFLNLGEMIRYGLPLVVGGVSFWGLTAADRYLLRGMSNFDELGIYSVAVMLASAAAVLHRVFSTVWAPTVYKWAAAGDDLQRVDTVGEFVLAAVAAMFCLAGLLSGLVLFLLPPEYASVQFLLMPCLYYPLMYILSEVSVVGVNLSKRTGFAMAAGVAAMLLNVGLNFLLIPHFAASGAAVATAISFWFFLMLRTEFSCRVWRPLPRRKMYVVTLAGLVAASWAVWMGPQLGSWYYLVWLIGLLLCLALFWPTYRVALQWGMSAARRRLAKD